MDGAKYAVLAGMAASEIDMRHRKSRLLAAFSEHG
jgi:hypothetical protein